MKRCLILLVLALVGLVLPTGSAQADQPENKKVVVCKYVGTPPGTPDHIIVVDAPKDFPGTFPWTFADAQDSVAIRFAEGNEQPGDEELVNCPVEECPPGSDREGEPVNGLPCDNEPPVLECGDEGYVPVGDECDPVLPDCLDPAYRADHPKECEAMPPPSDDCTSPTYFKNHKKECTAPPTDEPDVTVVVDPAPRRAAAPVPTQVNAGLTSSLPNTGGPSDALMLAAGSMLLMVGGGLLLRARRAVRCE